MRIVFEVSNSVRFSSHNQNVEILTWKELFKAVEQKNHFFGGEICKAYSFNVLQNYSHSAPDVILFLVKKIR